MQKIKNQFSFITNEDLLAENQFEEISVNVITNISTNYGHAKKKNKTIKKAVQFCIPSEENLLDDGNEDDTKPKLVRMEESYNEVMAEKGKWKIDEELYK